MQTFILAESDVGEVVKAILLRREFSKIILLKGDLGSGKTTLARQLIKELGVRDIVTSPTFNIISEYNHADGATLYHFDLYRINSTDELYEIGFPETIDSGNFCIIEWPEIAEPFLSVNKIEVTISPVDDQRKYTVKSLPSITNS